MSSIIGDAASSIDGSFDWFIFRNVGPSSQSDSIRPLAVVPQVAKSAGPAAYQECIEGIAKTNERVVASLAIQNLPKCHPEVFEGDATLFHPWKKSFNAMIHDANLNPNQEMAYLRNYTKGKVRELVDNYRKRQQSDPVITLRDLWTEMGS
ncbi:Hypothetical predicted protein [Paramuricea clavata]|uniref:Uncharacterized protein n=1 Tax=Paramuricea clavata TaxID=317549 RepID=A0A7D9K4B5_PARCT|nr:Hypothetical predicted protein [Paramuricea clavata]